MILTTDDVTIFLQRKAVLLGSHVAEPHCCGEVCNAESRTPLQSVENGPARGAIEPLSRRCLIGCHEQRSIDHVQSVAIQQDEAGV